MDEQIFGTGREFKEYEDIGWLRASNDLANEAALYQTKWFDYRFVHPIEATYLYAHAFVQSYREAHARNFDRARAQYIKPQKHDDLFECKPHYVGGVFRGRQIADVLGIPYGFFTSSAIKHTLRYWKQSYLPRPRQIYQDWVCDAVAKDWSEWQEASLVYSQLPQYHAERFIGTPDQVQHRNWLFSIAFKRSNPVPALNQFVREGLLTPEIVKARLEDESNRGLSYAA